MVCALSVREVLTCALPFDLSSSDYGFHACVHAPTVSTEVGFTVRGHEDELTVLRCVDPVFELTWLSSEAVEVVAYDASIVSRFVVINHAVIRGTMFRFVRCRLRLVYIFFPYSPTTFVDDTHALFALSFYRESIHVAV